ncbi:hypothetical protein EYZ11_007738 [Aspergillus tanneri]|uniref:Uncharacterized protein n=1 Tax=Aspergillus tanneri TaxID=1220188 RepID=A0A4S3JEF3_9EURO|nr:hypothetical protein EYZ11_007738 [Aspergillus tanneri]
MGIQYFGVNLTTVTNNGDCRFSLDLELIAEV